VPGDQGEDAVPAHQFEELGRIRVGPVVVEIIRFLEDRSMERDDGIRRRVPGEILFELSSILVGH